MVDAVPERGIKLQTLVAVEPLDVNTLQFTVEGVDFISTAVGCAF